MVQVPLGEEGRGSSQGGLGAHILPGCKSTNKDSFLEFARFPHTHAFACSSPQPPCLGLATTSNEDCSLPAPRSPEQCFSNLIVPTNHWGSC